MIRHPEHACPELYTKMMRFEKLARDTGLEILVYCVWRSPKEQLEAYAQGRTKPGKIITWTKKSKHNKVDKDGKPASEAFDCVPIVFGKCAWDRADLYLKLGAIGKKCGLVWGGDWKGKDSPHFELP